MVLIFLQMDKDRDGRLTKEEFKEGSRMDPFIVHALSTDFDSTKLEQKK